MSVHEARAVRRNGPGAVWFAVCSDGCPLPRANSKEHAEWLSREHRLTSGIDEARRIARHTCAPHYDTESMEYGPPNECAACILDALGRAA